MHTLCVKPMACNQKEFQEIMKVHNSQNVMLVQGHNNQWNEAAVKMREWMQNEIGELVGGHCLCWGRQNLCTNTTARRRKEK